MSNLIYPQFQGWSVKKTKKPQWETNIKKAESGRETRSTRWSGPRYSITLKYNFMTDNSIQSVSLLKGDLEKLQGFFNSVGGQFDDFLYFDDVENHCTNQTFAIADGTSTQFQLVRSLPDWVEPVRGIVETPHIFIDGVETTDFSYSSTGLIKFNDPPAEKAILSWSGNYYFRVRFDTDELELERSWEGLYEDIEVPLITVK